MATEVGQAYVTLIPSAKGFASKMQSELGHDISAAGTTAGTQYGDKVSKSAGGRMKAGAKKMFAPLAAAGPLAAVAAGAAVGKILVDSIGEARESAKVSARTAGVIKSMGNASKISADQVGDLATSLSNKTGIDDEVIQSGQNLLLTFGNIRDEAGKGNKIFSETSGLMVDMAAAMGNEPKGAAIQLGKALNDPIKGVAALTRSGVSFTQKQKDTIKSLQESGDMLGAQKVVLKEVKKEFSGAAEQMASPADKAKVAWGNFQESIGTALLPLVDKILTAFAKALPYVLQFGKAIGRYLAPAFKKIGEFIEQFRGNLGESSGEMTKVKKLFTDVLKTVTVVVSGVIELLGLVWQAFGDDIMAYLKPAFDNAMEIIGGAMKVIQGIIDLVLGILTGDWARAWDGIKQILSGAWSIIKGVVKQAINLVKLLLAVGWKLVVGIFKRAWDLIKLAVSAGIRGLIALVKKLPGWLWAALKGLGKLLSLLFRKAFELAKKAVSAGADKIVAAIKAVPGKLRALGGLLKDAGKALLGKLLDGLKAGAGFAGDLASKVWDAIKGFINDGLTRLNDLLEFTIKIGPKSFTVNPPDIPQLASGGRATSATLAVIGEGREAETVLPDSMLRGLLERTAGQGLGNVAQLTITNWHDGTGYLRLVASDVIGDDAAMRRDLGVMRGA